jgi:hypothetical protein
MPLTREDRIYRLTHFESELLSPTTTASKEPMWTLKDALELIKILQPESRKFGFHLTLGGGVLNKGESTKDLDLYFISLVNKNNPHKTEELVEWLTSLWGKPSKIGDNYNKAQGIYDSGPLNLAPSHFVTAHPDGTIVAEVSPSTSASQPSIYKERLKFLRGEDRIDVFVIA